MFYLHSYQHHGMFACYQLMGMYCTYIL